MGRRRGADTLAMMRTFCVVMFALLCAALGAETVMVAVGRSRSPGEDEKTENFRLSAVEDGIMESFFLADTIVFNDGGPVSPAQKPALMRRAREGGAGRLLLVEVFFSGALGGAAEGAGVLGVSGGGGAAGTETLPEKLRYSYYQVEDQRLLLSAELDAGAVAREESVSPEAHCARLGGEIARRVLAAGRGGKTSSGGP